MRNTNHRYDLQTPVIGRNPIHHHKFTFQNHFSSSSQTKEGILHLIATDRFVSYYGYQNIILTKKINKYKSHSAADNFHRCGGANLKAIIFVNDPHVNWLNWPNKNIHGFYPLLWPDRDTFCTYILYPYTSLERDSCLPCPSTCPDKDRWSFGIGCRGVRRSLILPVRLPVRTETAAFLVRLHVRTEIDVFPVRWSSGDGVHGSSQEFESLYFAFHSV